MHVLRNFADDWVRRPITFFVRQIVQMHNQFNYQLYHTLNKDCLKYNLLQALPPPLVNTISYGNVTTKYVKSLSLMSLYLTS